MRLMLLPLSRSLGVGTVDERHLDPSALRGRLIEPGSGRLEDEAFIQRRSASSCRRNNISALPLSTPEAYLQRVQFA